MQGGILHWSVFTYLITAPIELSMAEEAVSLASFQIQGQEPQVYF